MTTWTAASLLAEIAAIGRNEDGSYSRFCLRPEEVALREWFVAKATELGLAIVTDANANIWAWWGTPGPDAVLTGSHLDSVPGGGAYDGPLGRLVIGGCGEDARSRDHAGETFRSRRHG